MARLNLLIALLLALLASAASADDIRVEQAWIRAVPPVSSAMAAYFTLTNQTGHSVTLTGGKAGFAGRVGLHVMRPADQDPGPGEALGGMQHLAAVAVAPGETLVFRPGARHLMLMDLASVPEAGTTVVLCLTFREHPDVCSPFEVRRRAP